MEKMSDQLTMEEVKKAFMGCYLEDNYAFIEEDLLKLANAFIAAAAPKIAKLERDRNIEFVRSLNTEVARAMIEYADNV
jgi:hypothetical protein